MSIRLAAKLNTIEDLYEALDDEFKAELENDKCCLFRILKVPTAKILVPLFEVLMEFYDTTLSVFKFGNVLLNVTLEDTLFHTWLPIEGDALIQKREGEKNALKDALGLKEETQRVSLIELRKIACDTKRISKDERKIAVLLTIVECFIAPASGWHSVNNTFVKYVKDVDKVNSYAWGAALLAFLYSGLEKNKKSMGNAWLIVCFFLIRIPRLCDAIGLPRIELDTLHEHSPLLFQVVDKVKLISGNINNQYKENVRTILHNLTDEDIEWTPYIPSMLPLFLHDQIKFGTRLTPIFCDSYVVHHRPHIVSKQFLLFDEYNLCSLSWKDYKIKHKSASGPSAQDFPKHYKKELDSWKKKILAQNLMRKKVTITHKRKRR